MMNICERDFINAVKAGINADTARLEGNDFCKIFELALQQKLLPFVFEAVRSSPVPEDCTKLFSTANQCVISQVLAQTMRSAELEKIYAALREAGLHPILVKGCICGRLYPIKDYRLSADSDLFVSDDEFLRCHNILLQNGFKTDCSEKELFSEDEVSYTKENTASYIELHRRLFDSAEDAYDELNGFFVDAHAHFVSTDGFFTMPPHEHMLYLFLHAYKHFVGCGIGLRQFCDIGLWAKAYYEDIDWALLKKQLLSVHAFGFAAAVLKIAKKYLGIDVEPPQPWEEATTPCEPLLEDTLCGGIYGSNDYTRLHSSTVTLNAVRSVRDGKKRGIMFSLFPERSYMEKKYVYVKKHPWLLPAAWVQRMLHYAKELRTGKGRAADSVKVANARIELMKMYGII